MGHAHQAWVSPCQSFSFIFLFRLIPWSAGAFCVHFPAWASKTHSRRCLRWAPSAIREGACGLCEQSKSCAGALLAFCINQGISASFLSSVFLTAKFFPYLLLYFSQSLTLSSRGNPWIQPGLDPGTWPLCPLHHLPFHNVLADLGGPCEPDLPHVRVI